MANQFTVTPLGGFNLGNALGDAFATRERRDLMQKQEQEKQEMQGFMRQAIDGDPAAMKEVFVRNPNIGMQLQQIESERQAKLGQERKQLFDNNNFNYAKRVRMASPEELPVIIQQAIEDPNSDLYDQDDLNISADEAKLDANMALYSRVGDKGYEAMFGGQPEPMTEYQSAMIKGKDADRVLRQAEVENKKIDNQIKRETNKVKLDELKAKKKANEDKQEGIKKQKTEAALTVVDSGKSTLDLISEIESHPGFESAIGAKGASSLFGALDSPFSGTDAAGVNALIETLEAQNFLTAIGEFKSAGGAGALSDNEGKKLGAALSNLSTSQSEKDFNKSLNVIRNLVKKQISNAKPNIDERFVLDRQEVGASSANELSDEELIKKYGG